MPIIIPETLAILRRHDTPTICNALEHVMGGRTAEGFTKTPVVAPVVLVVRLPLSDCHLRLSGVITPFPSVSWSR